MSFLDMARMQALQNPAVSSTMLALTKIQNDKAAEEAQTQDAENKASEKYTIYTDKNGQRKMDIKGASMSDPGAMLDEATTFQNEQLKRNLDLANQMSATATPEAVKQDLSTFGGRFKEASRRGMPLGSALVAAAMTDPNDPNVIARVQASRQARVGQFAKEAVDPTLTELRNEQKASLSEKRMERLLGKDNAATIKALPFESWSADQDLTQGAQALGKNVEDLTPQERAGITNSATLRRSTVEKDRAKIASEAITKIGLPDVAGLDSQDAKDAYVASMAKAHSMTPDEITSLKTRVNGLARQYGRLDERQRLQIQQEQQRIDQNAKALAIQKQAATGTGEKVLEGMPEQTKNLIRGIASGAIDISKVTSMRGGDRRAVAELVAAYDPTWSTATAPARAQTYRDYTSGKSYQSIVSFNTAIRHLDTAQEAADKLKNASPQFWNRVKNFGLEQSGDPRVGNLMTAVDLLGGEIAKAAAGKAGTDQEIQAARQQMGKAQSSAQFRGAFDTYIKLLAGKAAELRSGYEATMGTAPPKDLIFSKETQRILAKRGFNSLIETATTPGGGGPTMGGSVISLDDALGRIGKGKQ